MIPRNSGPVFLLRVYHLEHYDIKTVNVVPMIEIPLGDS